MEPDQDGDAPDDATVLCSLALAVEREDERRRAEAREDERLPASPRDHAEDRKQEAGVQARPGGVA